MSQPSPVFHLAAFTVALVIATAPPTAWADAPERATRPDPRPGPAAEWREEQRGDAEAQKLREDWLDWQRDRGGTYREFLRQRQATERETRELERKERLEQLSPERDGERLGERLEAQRQESFERLEEPTPDQRLRPGTLRRNRPGLRN